MKTKTLCQFKLHFAVVNKEVDFKRLFAECSNFSSEWLRHCAMTACLLGDEDLLKLTIDRDINLCSLRFEGYCYAFDYPVELAYRNGHSHIVKLLLRSNSQVMNPRNGLAEELVRTAIWSRDEDLLSLLLMQDSVDVHSQYAGGGQAVHIACLRGSLECLGLLIEAGATLEATDQLDFSAFQCLALNLPPETAILGWIPVSGTECAAILHAILRQSPNFVTPAEGHAWSAAYTRSIQSIAGYLVGGEAFKCLQSCGSGCRSSQSVIDRFEQHLTEAVRRPDVMASLESIRQRTRPRDAATPLHGGLNDFGYQNRLVLYGDDKQ